jgi:hypothetical protein
LRLNAGFLAVRGPAHNLARDKLAELCRRLGCDNYADICEPLLGCRQGQKLLARGIEPIDDFFSVATLLACVVLVPISSV